MRTRQYPGPLLDADFVAKYAKEDDPFTSNAAQAVKAFYRWLGGLPDEHVWHYQTADDFAARIREAMSAGASPRDINRLWWRDMLHQCQAFSLLSTWRALDLVKNTIWAIRRRELLTAATVARAAIETVANYAWFQRIVRPSLDDVWSFHNSTIAKGESIVIISELEDEILRTLYASREQEADKIYSPKNIVTKIQNISKLPNQACLMQSYAKLCEYVHPNMLGIFVFAHGADGSIRIKNQYSESSDDIIRPIVFALSWSCNTLPLSVNALQESAGRLIRLVTE